MIQNKVNHGGESVAERDGPDVKWEMSFFQHRKSCLHRGDQKGQRWKR